MDKELFDFVAERADILATADSSKQATKDAALDWKEAVEADPSCADAETAKLVEGVIAFLEGPAKEILGEEAAAAGLAAQLERKEAGAKWCDCPACTAATEILAKFGRIEL